MVFRPDSIKASWWATDMDRFASTSRQERTASTSSASEGEREALAAARSGARTPQSTRAE